MSCLTLVLTGATTGSFTRNQKAFYADANVVAFVRPGLVIKIISAQVAQDGTISVDFFGDRSQRAAICKACRA